MAPVLRGVVVAPAVVRGREGVFGEEEVAVGLEAGDFGVEVLVPGLVADLVPDVGRVGVVVLDGPTGFAVGVVFAELGALRAVVGFFDAVVRVVGPLVAAVALTPVVLVVPVRLAVVAPWVLGAVVRLTPVLVAAVVFAASVVAVFAPVVAPVEGLPPVEVVVLDAVLVTAVLVALVAVVVLVVFFAGPVPAAPVLFREPPLLAEEASNFSFSCFFFSSISLRFCSAASFFCLSFSFLSSIFFFFSSSCCSFNFFALSSLSLMASAEAVGPFRPLAAADLEEAAAPAPALVFVAPVAPVAGFLVAPAVARVVDVPAPGKEARERERGRGRNKGVKMKTSNTAD